MIEKMKFVSITGPTDDIDRMINTYLSKYEIHLRNAMLEHTSIDDLRPYAEANPYKDTLSKASMLVSYIKDVKVTEEKTLTVDASRKLISKLSSQIAKLNSQIEGLTEKRKKYQDNYDKISPFMDLHYDISSILHFNNIKFRFGRIPKEYYKRLEAYDANNPASIFEKCKTDDQYVWGVYFVPESEKHKVDATYSSMHFEKTYIPGVSKGTPEELCKELDEKIELIDEKIILVKNTILECLESEKENIVIAYERAKTAYENFDVRKMAACTTDRGIDFYIICGWMSKKDALAFEKEVTGDDDVVCIIEDTKDNTKRMPPTKLKNPRIFKPFEMYIRMYGLPAYNELDPTIFVALTYSFIFGVMFGDVGQGAVLCIGGLLLYLIKKMNLAAIVSCAGFFSMLWGFMFGSVFGFEDIIEPLWLHPASHMSTIPFVGRLNTVFIVAVAFGMGLILFTMVLHIINGIKSKDIENTYFDTNALAGLLFYGTIVAAVVLFMTGNKLPSTLILVLMLVIPLLLIALKEPLTNLIKKKPEIFPESIGMFITQSFFELFEVFLSYFSNTLSFIRIGAFAVSHAAMMEVVLMLAGAESGSPNMLVVVLGNLFVMCLEGLIVGIQVLRLEYYEMFSRFYKGTGHEFKPFKHK